MYHGDKCDVDRVSRDVGGMIDFVQVYDTQDSEWNCSELCQYMSPPFGRLLYVRFGVKDNIARSFFAIGRWRLKSRYIGARPT